MHAFPKSARLRASREFRGALDHGKKAVCPLVVLFLKERSQSAEEKTPRTIDGMRLGIIASRKVGNAIARNRVKRHLREAFRHLKPELDAASELFRTADLVVIARPGAADADGVAIADALRHCLKRLVRQTEAT